MPAGDERRTLPLAGDPASERATGRLDARAPGGLVAGTILVGRFLLRELVGEGGGGAVWRASDLALDEEVAVKILTGPISDHAVARFRREVRVTRRIAHPNVVRVFDLVSGGERDLHLLSMQWIPGSTLTDVVARRGRLQRRMVLKILRGVASALAAAHRAGIVHRDVKPDNVMIGAEGEPYLLDFGVALEAGATSLTGQGLAPGTPGYMAPEQERGDKVGPQADLYGLGLTLAYALGVGEHASSRGHLPRRLRRILGRCLAPDPADRYPDADALLADLARADRRRNAAFAGGILAAAAAFAAAVRLVAAAPTPVVAVARFENRTGDTGMTWLERAAAELVAADLAEAGDVRVVAPVRGPPAGLHLVAGEVTGPPPALRARFLGPSGDVLREVDATPSLDVFRQADAIAAAVRASLRLPPRAGPGSARLTTPDAEALRAFAEALDRIAAHRKAEALDLLRRAAAVSPGFVRAQLALSMLTRSEGAGSRAEARAALSKAVAAAADAAPRDRELVEAVAAHESSAPDVQPLKRYLERHPGDAFAHHLVARLYGGHGPEQIALLERWIVDIPDDPEPHNQLGYKLLLRRDVGAAERHFREVIRLAPGDPNGYDSLADSLAEQLRPREALAAADQALALSPTFPPALSKAPGYALRMDELGDAERRLGAAEKEVPPESVLFDLVLRVGAAVRLLREDPAAAIAYLDRMARDPRTRGRAFTARHIEAVIRALQGDVEGARRAMDLADQAAQAYHADALHSPRLYVEALAVDADADRLARLAPAIAAVGAALPPHAHAVAEARRHQFLGDVAAAIEVLKAAPGAEKDGSSFLAAFLLARALKQAGRVGEAKMAYAEAVRRRMLYPEFPEPAYYWSNCLAEAIVAFRQAGDETGAAELARRVDRIRRP